MEHGKDVLEMASQACLYGWNLAHMVSLVGL